MRTKLLVMLIAVLLLSACKDTGRTLPSATGTIYEALVVMPDQLWQAEAGDSIRKYMAADMPCMPQMEPMLSVSQVSPQHFDDFLKPVRNMLYVDINPDRYTHAKLVFKKNYYSQPQAYCRLQIPSADSLANYLGEHGKQITDYFIREELVRQAKFYKTFCNTKAREAAQSRFGIDVTIPSDYMLIKDTADLVWAVQEAGGIRADILIYSYPYTDPQTFTKDFLLRKRDSIMGKQISGMIAGSYMGTEYKQIPPIMNEISMNGSYCAELRGLWKMYAGEAMGGPFVQHTRLDEISQQIITAEVHIFAPGQQKRNAMRKAEAILYSIRMPQEINQLKEVEINPTEQSAE